MKREPQSHNEVGVKRGSESSRQLNRNQDNTLMKKKHDTISDIGCFYEQNKFE